MLKIKSMGGFQGLNSRPCGTRVDVLMLLTCLRVGRCDFCCCCEREEEKDGGVRDKDH